MNNVNFILRIVLCIGFATLSHGVISDVMDRCCDIGRQWYITNRESCSPYTSPISGVLARDRTACNSLVEVCCLLHRKNKQCTIGKQSAKLRRNCDGLHSRHGSEDARECCTCCNLGTIAREQGESCTLFKRYGHQCDAAFHECCGGAGHRPNLDSATHVPTTTPIPVFPEGSDMDICSKFQSQLCQQVCINTPGSYECACFEGFTLQSDRRMCRQDASGSRCDSNNQCQHKCVDAGITTHCQCFEGYVLDTDDRNCRDINECALNSHSCTYQQRCVNTQGSYICEGPTQDRCPHGHTWNRLLGQCEDIDECVSLSRPCQENQSCVNSRGSFRCVTNVNNDREISDSDDDPYKEYDVPTAVPRTVPTSTTQDPLSLRCGTGFLYSSHTRQCEDINECAMYQDTCSEGQTCENSIGSFQCRRSMSCGTGYTLDQDSQLCLDDDECRMGSHNCGVARDCTNIPGSFRCVPKTCPLGYKLDYRSGICEPVDCPRGMKPDLDGNCIDINECIERPLVCRANQECRNTVGSYTCHSLLVCGPGYALNEAGTRCDDVNECQTDKHECTGHLMECINRLGSYMCQCPQGYQINHALKICEDLDECLYNGQTCPQNARCENTHGSFRCLCKEGFTEDEYSSSNNAGTCKDIDECARPGMCQQNCRNTWGSFQCTCDEGYQLAADGRTCDDADECRAAADKGVLLCLGVCENTHGSFICTCRTGFQMGSDGRTCQDVDECTSRTANCNTDSDVCTNTRGGFKCEMVTCPKGFVKAPAISGRSSNVKCQRKTFLCPQGDVECLYAPLSYSTNFITFPTKIRIPADLFTMRGPLSSFRRLAFDLKVIRASDPYTRETRVNRSFFNILQVRDNEAVVQLLQEVEGPQDIELQLDMNIYSKEFRQNDEEVFFGTAVARIFIYVTKDEW